MNARSTGAEFPAFDLDVAPTGYAWWYLDALSDDGTHGLTCIAFLGSVFSPYYAWALGRGRSDALDHCAINVAIYSPGGKHWTLTERGRSALDRSPSTLAIGPSALHWDGSRLTIDIDEISVPLPSRVCGRVVIEPSALVTRRFPLDLGEHHHWWPVAPLGRVQVAMKSPSVNWSGNAYLDHNVGHEPLARAFLGWQWSRGHGVDGTVVHYDLERRAGGEHHLALHFNERGQVAPVESPPRVRLKDSAWRVPRHTRANLARPPAVLRTLEDTPFYARSLLSMPHATGARLVVHESLCLQRFRNPVVQLMLPFRMPRRARWPAVTASNLANPKQ